MQITVRKVFNLIYRKLLYFYYIKKPNIELGKNVIFIRKPLIDVHTNAYLKIGENVMINSQNKGYHVNMFNLCKFIASKPNAIIEIGSNTRIHGSCIHACKRISIGKNCLIAANCQIIDSSGHDISFPDTANRIRTKGSSKDVVIEDNVWLTMGVIVLPGITIGKGSIITPNSVVNVDIPSMVIAGGNPISIIKEIR